MNYYEPRNSNYCYPNSNILKNKFDVRDAKKLEEIISNSIYKINERERER